MLTVAPMGRTKDEVRSLTPRLPLTHRIVTGRVATDEEVEKAVIWASRMALRNLPRRHALDADGGNDGVDEEDHEGKAEDHDEAVAQAGS